MEPKTIITEPFPPGLHIKPDPSRHPKKKPLGKPLPQQAQAPATPGAEEPHRPPGPIAIEQLYSPGVYAKKVRQFFSECDDAFIALQDRLRGSERDIPRVNTVVIKQDEQPTWARGIVWDCSDRDNCLPVERSDASTKFAATMQINRANIRRMAAEVGGHHEHKELVDQICNGSCNGGVESGSDCELITVLAFHHSGLLKEIGEAHKTIKKEFENQWSSRPVRDLPFVPCRLLPRDVVMQERVEIVEGTVDAHGQPAVKPYMKARVTMNLSHGGADSVNAAVPPGERTVALPRVQWLAKAVAITDLAGDTIYNAIDEGDTDWGRVDYSLQPERPVKAATYVIDDESAYPHLPMQRSEWWKQCFIWAPGLDNMPPSHSGVCVGMTLMFGGAKGPCSFQNIQTIIDMWAMQRIRAFDRANPLPPSAQLWALRRQRAQREGRLPLGEEQLEPSYLHNYIDDNCGTALDDPVPTPDELADIVIDPTPTQALGGTFPEPDARVLVHAKILIHALRLAGLTVSMKKVLVGDPIISLGFTVDRRNNRLKVPSLKRASMLSTIATLEAQARSHATADRKEAERLMGRLVNISQVAPELSTFLAGGYRATAAGWASRRGIRIPRLIKMRRDSLAHQAWLEMLSAARGFLEANEGVPLAPVKRFPSKGNVISTTDASGNDGFGGYVFMPDEHKTVWIVTEPWPAWAQEARERCDLRFSERSPQSAPERSMPAAELLASWLVPLAVLSTVDEDLTARASSPYHIVSISDCEPAVDAMNKATSGEDTMGGIINLSRFLSRQWLGVAVPRQANRDADSLSHPETAWHAVREAVPSDWTIKHAIVPHWAWAKVRSLLIKIAVDKAHYKTTGGR